VLKVVIPGPGRGAGKRKPGITGIIKTVSFVEKPIIVDHSSVFWRVLRFRGFPPEKVSANSETGKREEDQNCQKGKKRGEIEEKRRHREPPSLREGGGALCASGPPPPSPKVMSRLLTSFLFP